MNIEVLCSDRKHQANRYLKLWKQRRADVYNINLVHKAEALSGGDFLFLISATEILSVDTAAKFRYALVIHESEVPEGRGWSPLTWQVLEGKSTIPITMLGAEEGVDSGPIWDQQVLELNGGELYDEIIKKVMEVKISMMEYAISNQDKISPIPQAERKGTYYRRRTPEDSRIDPHLSIADQFNLLRVCDPNRFPAFFELRGYRYQIVLRKIGKVLREDS